MHFDTLISNGILVCPDRGPIAADIGVTGEHIAAVLSPGQGADARVIIDASGQHIFPGLIDAHVHFGFAEPVTEYTSETIHAAQGGFTSVLGYFLGSRSYRDVFAEELPLATERAFVDFGFHFCAATERHLEELGGYAHDLGVTSFKYFMNFKGSEGLYLGVEGTDDGYFHDLLEKAASLGEVTVVVHTENIELVNRMRQAFQSSGRNTLRDWSLAKPPITEAEPTVRAMMFAEHLGARIYIPHLSTRSALNEVRRWRERYSNIFVETCPHYLTHTMDADIGSMGKANPPFRSADDVAAMWEGLADGSIDVVASDHVPRKRSTKDKPLWQASQGFPGTATILPILLDQGYHRGRLSLQRIAQLLTSRPAEIFGIAESKGRVAPGLHADLTLVNLDFERVVRADELGSYSDYSLYDDWRLKGWPRRTIVRGTTVMQDGVITGAGGHGRYIRRALASRTPH